MIKELNYSSPEKMAARMDYCLDAVHPNHVNKTIIGPIPHLVRDLGSFAWDATTAWSRMREQRTKRRTRGPTPRQAYGEIIYRSPYGADLSDDEMTEILEGIFEDIARDCPALAYWHGHPDGTWDLHVLISNCTWDHEPRLRKGFSGNGGPNYYRILHDCENRALEVINHRRAQNGRPRIEMMKEARERLARAKGIVAVHLELALLQEEVSGATIVGQLEMLGHIGKLDDERVIISFNGSDRQHRYNLKKLLAAVADERAKVNIPVGRSS